MKENLSLWALALQLSSLLIGFLLGSILIGLWVDQQAQTAPFGTLSGMLIGIVLSTIAIYRQIGGIYQQIAPLSPSRRVLPEDDEDEDSD